MWHSKLLGTDSFPTTSLRLELPEEPTVPHWSKGLDADHQNQDHSEDQNWQIRKFVVNKLKLNKSKYLKSVNNLI